MERHDACYRQYVQILREELRPATGCTEPIAIAYAAAKARSVLGALPDRVLVGRTLYWITPACVSTSTTSPAFLPIRA